MMSKLYYYLKLRTQRVKKKTRFNKIYSHKLILEIIIKSLQNLKIKIFYTKIHLQIILKALQIVKLVIRNKNKKINKGMYPIKTLLKVLFKKRINRVNFNNSTKAIYHCKNKIKAYLIMICYIIKKINFNRHKRMN